MQALMGRRKQRHLSKSSKKCGALCCGSRLSTSSSSSSSPEEAKSSDSDQLDALSSFAHAMVQARLEQMINDSAARTEQRRRGGSSGNRYIILIAMDKSSYDPVSDFRESMIEVITSKGVDEPKELRRLLNCYLSMNSKEHRQVILEVFHQVCSSLFLCT